VRDEERFAFLLALVALFMITVYVVRVLQ